jgi:peptide/nickel transport system substrate-binding protein
MNIGRSLRACVLAALAVLLAAGLAQPAAAQTKVLRVVPQADLFTVDPVWGTTWIALIHGTMIYESLFTWDSKMQPKPEMVSTWSSSPDGMTWRFTLRDGLRFHDGSPVTTADVIASTQRWMARDVLAGKLNEATASLTPIDEKTFEWKLSKPFPSIIELLAASPARFPAIMRAKDLTDSTKPITTTIGSGPFRFVDSERLSGARYVYEKNTDYVPRSEPPDGLSGARIVKVDRVEWHIIPDPATQAAALQNNEVDLLESPSLDLLPMFEKDKNIEIKTLAPLDYQAYLRPNQIYPPFNNVKARQALAYIVNQDDVMTAGYGDQKYWRDCNSFFICGSPNGTEAGTEGLHQDFAKARELMAEAGYKGEKLTFVTTHELPWLGQMAEVVADEARKAGMNIDLVYVDWGTFVQRVRSQNPPDKGGWHLLVSYAQGTMFWDPMTNVGVDMSCNRTNLAGWACDEPTEALRQSYLTAPVADRPALLDKLQRRLVEMQPLHVLGQGRHPVAYRAELKGLLAAPVIAYWNIEKP